MGGTAAAGHTVRHDGQQIAKRRVHSPRGGGLARRWLFVFFDIVGLDEGTCGRRLAGSGGIKALDTRLKLSRSHDVLHVSIRKDIICAERLLEMDGWARAFHLGLVVT